MTSAYRIKDRYHLDLGNFIAKFSELEFSLYYYCATIESPGDPSSVVKNIVGDSLETNRKRIRKFIKEKTPTLLSRWEQIDANIFEINQDRKYLIHGIGESYFYSETLKTVNKKQGEIKIKVFSLKDIETLTERVLHVLTGNAGLTGEFYVDFKIARFDYHNFHTTADDKIIYSVNSKILTVFKGRPSP